MDLDFREALNAITVRPSPSTPALLSEPNWLVDDALPLTPAGNGLPAAVAASLKYQAGSPVTLDGNSVDLDREKVMAAENAVQYEAAAGFASQIIRMLMVAINGAGPQQSSGS